MAPRWRRLTWPAWRVWAATYSSGAKLCSTNVCARNRIEGRADQISGLANYWPNGRRLNALKGVSR